MINLTLDGLNVIRKEDAACGELVVLRDCKVQNLLLRNVNVVDQAGARGALVRLDKGAEIERLRVTEVDGGGVKMILRSEGGKADKALLPMES